MITRTDLHLHPQHDIRTRCEKCDLLIHQKFIGHHKCGHVNCPGCKIAITYSDYMNHIRSHGRPKIQNNEQGSHLKKVHNSKIYPMKLGLQQEELRQAASIKLNDRLPKIHLRPKRQKQDYLGAAIIKEQAKTDGGSYW